MLVRPAGIAAVPSPRRLPANNELMRSSAMFFISRSLTLFSMGTAPSERNRFNVGKDLRNYNAAALSADPVTGRPCAILAANLITTLRGRSRSDCTAALLASLWDCVQNGQLIHRSEQLHGAVVPFCTFMSHARSDLSPLKSGGDDGARTRDLCRDRAAL